MNELEKAIYDALTSEGEKVEKCTVCKKMEDEEAVFVWCDLEYEDGNILVPFVIYHTGEFFTPVDWQAFGLNAMEEMSMDEIEWRYGLTNIPGVMLNGKPRIFR